MVETLNCFAHPPNLKRPMVTIHLRNKSFEALIDTGAQISCMNEKAFKASPHNAVLTRLDTGKKPVATAANGSPLEFVGVYLMQFNVPEIGTCTWPMAIIRDLKSPVILGKDFQQACGAQIDMETNRVTWRRAPDDRSTQMRPLILRQNTIVQPKSQVRVAVIAAGDRDGRHLGATAQTSIPCIETL